MFRNIGTSELILILLILLILFGRKRLSEFGRNVGDVVREFKKALNEKKE